MQKLKHRFYPYKGSDTKLQNYNWYLNFNEYDNNHNSEMIIKQDAITENDPRFQQIILHLFVLLCDVKSAALLPKLHYKVLLSKHTQEVLHKSLNTLCANMHNSVCSNFQKFNQLKQSNSKYISINNFH